MATYLELFELRSDTALRSRVSIGITVAAEVIRTEAGSTPNHANRLTWAAAALAEPDKESLRMLSALLGQDSAFTVAQITGSSDAVILAAILVLVDTFATGV